MTRDVLLSGAADKVFQSLAKSVQRRVQAALLELASSGRNDVKRLHGTKGRADLFRTRVGDYRVIFALSDAEIRVTRIIHRREGYDWL